MENKLAKEMAELRAQAAIDWIDSLPGRISLMLIEGAYRHDLNVTKQATASAMESISETLSDLFFRDHCRKIDAYGEPIAANAVAVPYPNQSMRGFMAGMEARKAEEEAVLASLYERNKK